MANAIEHSGVCIVPDPTPASVLAETSFSFYPPYLRRLFTDRVRELAAPTLIKLRVFSDNTEVYSQGQISHQLRNLPVFALDSDIVSRCRVVALLDKRNSSTSRGVR